MDNFIIAMSRYKRRKYDQTLDLCNSMLDQNPRDQAAWLLKCNTLIRKQYLDDLEIDEEGLGDILLDDNTINNMARPGTSLQRPTTSSQGGLNPIQRPVSKAGRLQSGYARPGSSLRPTSTAGGNKLNTAQRSLKTGVSRPITSGGRYLRLGTASLANQGNDFIKVDKLDIKKMAKNEPVAIALCNYLLYVENNPKKALELAAECSNLGEYKNWWWKERLGKCYYLLGLYREAEKQFQSSLKNQEMIKTILELGRIYQKLDLPNNVIEMFQKYQETYPHEISFILNIARIYDMINESEKAVEHYRRVLYYESSNLEAVASIAAYHFYIDQPEISMRFYQRLVQLGVHSAELWNNLALCLFYDGQYDLFYSCFEKALEIADDSNKADIWYNISHIFINLGEIPMAYQCLKLVLCYDQHHAEAYNNLGILEIKKGNIDRGKYELQQSIKEGEFLIEPHFNAALWAYNCSEFQDAKQYVDKSLKIYPEHEESQRLKQSIMEMLEII